MNPRVSIIMPAYNAEHSIGTAIQSALAQTEASLEVVVVDDGSRDGTSTAALAAAQGDRRLVLVRHERNRGVSAARNTAIELARGEWIAVLDADDTFLPMRLEMLLAAGAEFAADAVADNLIVMPLRPDAQPSLAFPSVRMRSEDAISIRQFVDTDRPAWGTRASGFIKPLVRRGFLLEHSLRYEESLYAGSDFAFYVQALLRGARLFYVPQAYYHYMLSDASLCRGRSAPVYEAFLSGSRLLRVEAARFGRPDIVDRLLRREREIDAWFAYCELSNALHAGRFAEAQRVFWQLPSRSYALRRFAASARRRVGFGFAERAL